MDKSEKIVLCHRCGEAMEDGYAAATGLIGSTSPPGTPRLVFIVPGEKTSGNPLQAFKQGLQGDRANEAYLLRGYRCPACGTVELIARENVVWDP